MPDNEITAAAKSRVLACLNACDNISTYQLENYPPMMGTYYKMCEQRDVLLDAVTAICALDDGDNPAFWEDDAHNAFVIARAAIKKCAP